MLLEIKEAEEQGLPAPFYAADDKMADSVMDFLFASQDASTASLTWTVTLMSEHPDVFARVREEQERVRGTDLDAPITGDLLNEMKCVWIDQKCSLHGTHQGARDVRGHSQSPEQNMSHVLCYIASAM